MVIYESFSISLDSDHVFQFHCHAVGVRVSKSSHGENSEVVTRQLFWSFIVPIGVCIALEIGCSNVALKILSVSFGTILKGSAPVFTFGWGLVFGLEPFSCSVFMALLTIAVGIALASLGEGQEFLLLGFCLQLFSTALSGFRWAMTHRLLKGNSNSQEDQQPKLSPLTATLYTSPTTALCVMPFAFFLEHKAIAEHTFTDITEGVLIATVLVCIATMVFGLIMSEYWLVRASSSLALSVAAVFKELLTIGGGIFFFAEHLDTLNVLGFCTCQSGILAYVYLRYDNNTSQNQQYTPVEQPTNQPTTTEQRQGFVDDPDEEHVIT
ncbi:35 member C2 [Seminavis robusta]|uniref:35 member C2 n=1 Tax=Seminavis robusta TaxID=568900 RepID=A0A9N8DHQ5_9STRA|nr:35 member C2 [Seminavis robusta]|eukprot:Sro96_g049620.1 35 member C2 (324) ;mRNA; r:71135-72106